MRQHDNTISQHETTIGQHDNTLRQRNATKAHDAPVQKDTTMRQHETTTWQHDNTVAYWVLEQTFNGPNGTLYCKYNFITIRIFNPDGKTHFRPKTILRKQGPILYKIVATPKSDSKQLQYILPTESETNPNQTSKQLVGANVQQSKIRKGLE